jgi:LmbE family N-acetylglucosaminyl deacetylase
MSKILAFGAHPDDIEFYAGGTLAQLAADHEVIFVVATDGRYGGDPAVRRREQDRAAQTIGASRVIIWDYADGRLENQKIALKQKLLQILLAEKPEVVFSFDPEHQYVVHADFHPDHRTLALAVADVVLIDATVAGLKRPKLWLYDPHRPNRKTNISIVKKRAAVRQYVSQKLRLEPTRYEKFRIY